MTDAVSAFAAVVLENVPCGQTSLEFDATGQNKHAALSIVQINDLGNGLERITVWPKGARRAGYTPVFPVP